LGLIEEAKRAN